MRENMGLYHGKRKDNGEWIEGGLLKVTISGETCYLIFGEDFLTDGNEVVALIHALVDPETIGQFTGLTDKNGVMIFEGDILQSGNIKGTVKYSNKRAAFVFKWRRFTLHGGDFFKECDLSDFGEFSRLVVIGNIHDNPELLEVSSDE